jgi:glycosyltransferase involved in cell wall biosynthesis
MPKKQLTVVIPAYNEENRLPPTIRKALEWADKTSVFEIELIIVDDGSEDRTCELVREFASKDSRVRLIEETHVGAVHAILAGFRAAKYPLVGYMEADLAVHPREFETLLPFVNASGIAQGSRAIGKEKGQSVSVNKSLVRRIISWCMRTFFEILFKDQVEDPQIGFRLFRKESVLKITPLLRLWHDGLKHGEIVIRAYGIGMTVTEINVPYVHDANSRCFPKGLIKASFITVEAFAALITMWVQCSMDYNNGILERQTTRGAFLLWPFSLFLGKIRKKNN